jgi:hypothetical protein
VMPEWSGRSVWGSAALNNKRVYRLSIDMCIVS